MTKEFKKAAMVVVIISMILSLFTGCNRQIVDTTWKYDRAIVALADGTSVEGKVSSWLDYENSDQIQVVINGTAYLVHSSNVTLISE